MSSPINVQIGLAFENERQMDVASYRLNTKFWITRLLMSESFINFGNFQKLCKLNEKLYFFKVL